MTISLRAVTRPLAIAVALALPIAAWPATVAGAAPVKVTGVSLKEAPNELQVSIVASGPARYQTRDVQANWIVLDVQGARLAMPSGQLPLAKGVVRKVRVGQFADEVAIGPRVLDDGIGDVRDEHVLGRHVIVSTEDDVDSR